MFFYEVFLGFQRAETAYRRSLGVAPRSPVAAPPVRWAGMQSVRLVLVPVLPPVHEQVVSVFCVSVSSSSWKVDVCVLCVRGGGGMVARGV